MPRETVRLAWDPVVPLLAGRTRIVVMSRADVIRLHERVAFDVLRRNRENYLL